MKRARKIILGVVAAVFTIVIVFGGIIVYVANNKITTLDTSVSPDGIHEPVLQAVGDAGLPFGSVKEERTDAGDMNEMEEMNPQTAYAGESESQEDMEEDEKNANADDDIDSIEEINKYMIPEQSFDITLDDWGKVTFVSCRPPSWQYEDTPFFLVRDDQILYKFPNSTEGYAGLFDSVGAVAFRDINDDGKDDIILIINYIMGAGPQGMIPRPATRIFLAEENEFYLAEDMITDVEKYMADGDLTIENICNFLRDKNEW